MPQSGRPAAPPPVPEGRGRVRRRLTADEIQQRRRRITNWALSIVLGAVLINALFGENGYLATLRAARDEAATRAELARIRVENERLKKARVRLVSDDAAVEEAGRAMGLIRDGEILVTIKQPSATPARPAR
jgi:cell division protein FtsB